MTHKVNSGALYIVSTPIGHPHDITLRAIEVLKSVDGIICEEIRHGQKLLKGLDIEKSLSTLNEHNENEVVQNLLIDIMSGKNYALVSDCGTPVFSDPGKYLITTLTEMGIKIVPVPGPSSLMAALSVCTFNLDHFLFVGFLPPKADQRIFRLTGYSKHNQPLILMDTPYRLTKLLEEIIEVFGKKQAICLACDLTLPSEIIIHGSAEDIYKRFKGQKREFILIIDKPQKRTFS